MTRILSGMQPTGNLHLGNYLGALKNWVKMQDDGAECFYCIVDLHALTLPQDPQKLKHNVREVAAAYIAAGVDAGRSTLFVQSAVPAHCELSWILSTFTPLGWLNRMTQFKDKSKDAELLGLYAYPVLMAADILLYKPTHVPVGEDQKQHLELARDIAGVFNRFYKQEYFPLPAPYIVKETARIMSLRDGTKKMSKSDESDYSRINLMDDADTIALKFRKAKTDSDPLPDNLADLERRPEADNLVTIYAALSDRTKLQVLGEFSGKQFSTFKPALADLAIEKLAPIGVRFKQLMNDTAELDRILIAGNQAANQVASHHLSEIKGIVGLWNQDSNPMIR